MTSPWLFCLGKSRKHITTSKRPEAGLFLTFLHLGGYCDGDGEVILMQILLLVSINVTLGGGVQVVGDLIRASVT